MFEDDLASGLGDSADKHAALEKDLKTRYLRLDLFEKEFGDAAGQLGKHMQDMDRMRQDWQLENQIREEMWRKQQEMRGAQEVHPMQSSSLACP